MRREDIKCDSHEKGRRYSRDRKGGGSTLGNRGGERGGDGEMEGERGGEMGRERAREPEKMRFVFRI
jgi:hypothetical protein